MAKVISSSAKIIRIRFSTLELSAWRLEATTRSYLKRLFVNFALPTLYWKSHETQCLDDVLDAIRLVANWQGKLTDARPRLNAHAHPPTIMRDNGLRDQKIRYPVFAKHSSPYVQWVRSAEEESGFLLQGYSFNNDLPSLGAYFSAVTALKESFIQMNK